MRVMILGGTGLLGAATAAELAGVGEQVVVASRSASAGGLPGLGGVPVVRFDVTTASHAERVRLLAGMDALVYAVGPDDRRPFPGPAGAYLQRAMVDPTVATLKAAAEAGVRRVVVFGSYFTAWDRENPELGFAARHPYVGARTRQSEGALQVGERVGMAVTVLEIPYVFGSAPGRPGVFKEILLDRVRDRRVLAYPRGGATVTTVQQVARATVAALSSDRSLGNLPVGQENWDWNHMLQVVADVMGVRRSVVNVPRPVAELRSLQLAWNIRRRGKYFGLNPEHLMRDVMYQHMYVDHAPPRRELGYGSTDVAGAIAQSVALLYP